LTSLLLIRAGALGDLVLTLPLGLLFGWLGKQMAVAQ